jgi:hypothetical protein
LSSDRAVYFLLDSDDARPCRASAFRVQRWSSSTSRGTRCRSLDAGMGVSVLVDSSDNDRAELQRAVGVALFLVRNKGAQWQWSATDKRAQLWSSAAGRGRRRRFTCGRKWAPSKGEGGRGEAQALDAGEGVGRHVTRLLRPVHAGERENHKTWIRNLPVWTNLAINA